MLMLTLVAVAAETAEQVAAPAGIAAIGLDVKALLFQVVNFGILLWLLRRFAYKPLVQILEARRLRIEESLATAERLDAEKAKLATARQQTLAAAEQQAAAVISEARQQAATLIGDARRQAESEGQRLRQQTEAELERQRTDTKESVRREMVGLIARATEKVIDQKIDRTTDQRLIERAIQEVQSSS